jgi:tetratricopeptide (TPR) repeat protein
MQSSVYIVIIQEVEKKSQNSLYLKILMLAGLMLTPFSMMMNLSSTECLSTLFSAGKEVGDISSSEAYASSASCFPWRTDLWEQAGRQAEDEGDFTRMIDYLERATQEGLHYGGRSGEILSIESLKSLASAYRQQGEYSKALEALGAVARRDGLEIGLAYEMSSLHLIMGDYSAAAQVWQDLVDDEPDNAAANYHLGLLLAVRDPDAAFANLGEAARLDPVFADPAENLQQAIGSAHISDDQAFRLVISGRALASMSEWSLAAEAFRQATQIEPAYAEAWAFLGEALQHIPPREPANDPTGSQSAGLSELQNAVKLDPSSLAAHTLLALFHLRQGDNESALNEIREALVISPKNPILISQHASLLAASGKLDEAFDEYMRASLLAPNDPAYLRQAITFSLSYGFKVEQTAIPLARQLLVQDPGSSIDLDLMGQVMIKMGDLDSSERFLVRALRSNPGYAPAYLHLGLIALLRNDPKTGGEHLQTAIDLDPKSQTAEQARRLLEGGGP